MKRHAGEDDEEDEENPENDSDEDSDEDRDHDEVILGNVTDLVISLAKCYKDDFMPSLQKLGPKLVKYIGDDHPKSDQIMVIGCLSEVFNQCPSALTVYFNDFL